MWLNWLNLNFYHVSEIQSLSREIYPVSPEGPWEASELGQLTFNKEKQKVLHLGQNNLVCQYRLEANLQSTSYTGKDPALTVDA